MEASTTYAALPRTAGRDAAPFRTLFLYVLPCSEVRFKLAILVVSLGPSHLHPQPQRDPRLAVHFLGSSPQANQILENTDIRI